MREEILKLLNYRQDDFGDGTGEANAFGFEDNTGWGIGDADAEGDDECTGSGGGDFLTTSDRSWCTIVPLTYPNDYGGYYTWT